jgi:hypothetical protein
VVETYGHRYELVVEDDVAPPPPDDDEPAPLPRSETA